MAKKKKEAFGALSQVVTDQAAYSSGRLELPPQVAVMMELAVAEIHPSPNNPRKQIDTGRRFAELLESVENDGVKIPVLVRRIPGQVGYELMAGARRLRASVLAGKTQIPAMVYPAMTDEQAFELTFFENYAREDLTPLEQSEAVESLLSQYQGNAAKVAEKFGKTERWVRMQAFVCRNLSEDWKRALEDPDKAVSQWTLSHLVHIARLPESVQADLLWKFEDNFEATARQVQAECERQLRPMDKAVWDLDAAIAADAEDDPLPPCTGCSARSDYQPQLFGSEETGKGGLCLNGTCWEAKRRWAIQDKINQAKKQHPNLKLVASRERNYEEFYDLKRRHPEVVEAADGKPAKKDDPAAMPCLMLNGSSAGKIVYRKFDTPTDAKTAATIDPGPQDNLEAKREKLMRKRWAWMLGQLIDVLYQSEVDAIHGWDKEAAVLALASGFGVSVRHGNREWAKVFYGMENAKNPDVFTAMLDEIWGNIRPLLREDLFWNGPVTQTPDHKIDSGRQLARLLGIDLTALEAKAAEQMPEPKGWGNGL
jgi:ParB/RepB/Spo0J family partition protein